MSFFRLIAALLFAVVLLVVGYGVFWFMAFRFAEQKMTALLQQQLGAVVSYDVPQWQPELGKVSVKLPQVLARIIMPGNELMVIQLPHVVLQSGFFDDGSELKLFLPQEAGIKILRNNEPVAQYRVTLGGAEVLLLRNVLMASTQAGRIVNGDQMLLAWQNGQLKWEPLPDGAANVLIQAQNVQGVAGAADDVAYRGTVLGMQEMDGPTWSLLRAANKEALGSWLQDGVKALAAGGEVVIDALTVRQGDWHIAVSGNVAVDKDGVPYGDIVVQGDNGDTVAQVLENSGLIAPERTEERMRYDQAMVKFGQGETVGKLVLHQGVAILNTLRVGHVPSATAIVRKWM